MTVMCVFLWVYMFGYYDMVCVAQRQLLSQKKYYEKPEKEPREEAIGRGNGNWKITTAKKEKKGLLLILSVVANNLSVWSGTYQEPQCFSRNSVQNNRDTTHTVTHTPNHDKRQP